MPELVKVLEAHATTRNAFAHYWECPNVDEAEIFFQSILTVTFVLFGLPEKLLNEFYDFVSFEYLQTHTQVQYDALNALREQRCKEYFGLFGILEKCPFYKEGAIPTDKTEIEVATMLTLCTTGNISPKTPVSLERVIELCRLCTECQAKQFRIITAA